MDPKIVAIMIRTLRREGGKASFAVLDEAIREATVRRDIHARSSRRMRGSDEVVELEWLGVLSQDGDHVQLTSSDRLVAKLESDLETTLVKLLLSRELLYHLLIQYLRVHGDTPKREILNQIGSLTLDGRKYVDYGVDAEPGVQVRFNQAKLSYLIRLGRKLGQLREKKSSRDGGRVLSLTQPLDDPRAAIVATYRNRMGGTTFVTIDDLWRVFRDEHPGVTETVFDKSMLQLRDEFYPSVDLFQGSGRKFVSDPQLGKYYHHVRIDPESIESILTYLGMEG